MGQGLGDKKECGDDILNHAIENASVSKYVGKRRKGIEMKGKDE